MSKFKDYSISRKLLTGFLSVAVIMLAIGAIGVFGVFKIDTLDTYLYETQTAPIDHLINATTSLYKIRVETRGAVINAGKTTTIENFEKSYQSDKETFIAESAAYRESIKSAESIALFDEAADIFTNDFDPVIQKTFALAKTGNQAAADAAGASATDKIQKLFENYDKLADNRMASAKATSDSNDRTALIISIILIAFIIIGVCAAIILGIKISKLISKPIVKVVDAANSIALGHVDVELDITSKDETGQLAIAFMSMLESIRAQVLIAETISKGDFTKEVPLRSDKDALGLALKRIEEGLTSTLLSISTTADQVGVGAEQVSGASQALASGASEQAATVEQLNASITGIAQQAEDNAESVRKARQYMHEASLEVSESKDCMEKLSKAMNEIGVASEKISSITKVIEDIAFQTNILALNAAIEAARAGNAGKGFAVVADEVRNLAAKSAEAAKQTGELIQHSVDTVTDGEKLANESAKLIMGVADKSRLVTEAVKEIETVSTSQAKAIDEINQGMSQVSSVVQANAATAEESSASSEELAAQAHTLRQEVGKFTLLKSGFGKESALTKKIVKNEPLVQYEMNKYETNKYETNKHEINKHEINSRNDKY